MDMQSVPQDTTSVLNSMSATGTDIDRQLAGVLQSAEKSIQETTKERGKTLETLGKVSKELGERKFDKPPPNFPQPQPPPAPPLYEPIRAFGSFASTFGILASLLTKQPLASALNASGAAMTAYRRNDIEAYNEALKAFDENAKYAIDRAKFEQDNYKTAIDLYKTDFAKGDAALRTLTSLYQDQTMDLARQSGIIEKVWDARARLLEKADEHKDAMAVQGMKLQMTMQLAGPDKIAAMKHVEENPGESADQFDAWLQKRKQNLSASPMSPEATKLAAEMYVNTGQLPYLGFGDKGAAAREAILEEAAKITEGKGGAGAVMSTRSTLTADRTSLTQITKVLDSTAAFENTAKRNIDIVLQQMPAGQATNWGPWLDRWVQTGAKEIGDPNVPAYYTSIVTVLDEYAKIISGATGSAGSTDAARAQVAQMASVANTTDQLKNVFGVMVQDMDNRQVSYQAQAKTIQNRITAAGSSSAGVGTADIPSMAVGAWGSYDPGKYEYRVDPDSGALQRKAKE